MIVQIMAIIKERILIITRFMLQPVRWQLSNLKPIKWYRMVRSFLLLEPMPRIRISLWRQLADWVFSPVLIGFQSLDFYKCLYFPVAASSGFFHLEQHCHGFCLHWKSCWEAFTKFFQHLWIYRTRGSAISLSCTKKHEKALPYFYSEKRLSVNYRFSRSW